MRTAGKNAVAYLAVAALILLTFSSCSRGSQNTSSCESNTSAMESADSSAVDVSDCIQYPFMRCDLEPITAPVDTGKLYYRSQLTPDEQQLYDFLLYYAERCDTRDIYAPDLELNQFISTMGFVNEDNPQLFWVEDAVHFVPKDWNHIFQITYMYSRDRAVDMQKEIDSKTKTVLAGISSDRNPYDTELYFHDYLVKNCTYDKSMEKADDGSIYGALVQKEPVCAGYAKAMQYLLLKTGIPCLYVTGTAKDENNFNEGHAWNIVYIDNAYYQLDVTWDDQDDQSVLHRYFNVTTEMMNSSDHTFDTDNFNRKFTLPQCCDTADNYYIKNNLSFSEYNSKLVQTLKNTVINYNKAKKPFIEISFTNADAYKKAVDELINKDGMWNIIDSAHNQCSNPIGDTFTQWEMDDDLLLVIELHYT